MKDCSQNLQRITKFNSNYMNNLNKKYAKHFLSHLANGRDTDGKHMKRCPISFIREMHIKTPLKFHCTSIRTVKIQNTDNTKC